MVRTNPNSEVDIKPFSQTPNTKQSNGTGRGEKWTGEDRKALFIYVEKYGAGNWTSAALSVPGKTAKQGSVDVCLAPVPADDRKKQSPFLQKACQSA